MTIQEAIQIHGADAVFTAAAAAAGESDPSTTPPGFRILHNRNCG